MFNFFMGTYDYYNRFGYFFNIFVLSNKIYLVGADNIRRANIDTNGNIGPFSSYLTFTRMGQYGIQNQSTHIRPVVVGNKLYLFDYPYGYTGYNFPADVVSFDVNINGDLSNLTSYGNINPAAMRLNVKEVFVYKDKMFAIVSSVSSTDVTVRTGEYTIYYASINSDDTLGSWNVGPKITVNGSYFLSKAVTTKDGINVLFYISDGYGGGDYNCVSHRLNTDSQGIPVSWSPLYSFSGSLFSQDTLVGGNWPLAVVKNRLYIQAYFYDDFSNPWPVKEIRFDYLDFTGGVNDYSPYYDGSLSQSDPLNFFLPDFTAKETATTKYFIKT